MIVSLTSALYRAWPVWFRPGDAERSPPGPRLQLPPALQCSLLTCRPLRLSGASLDYRRTLNKLCFKRFQLHGCILFFFCFVTWYSPRMCCRRISYVLKYRSINGDSGTRRDSRSSRTSEPGRVRRRGARRAPLPAPRPTLPPRDLCMPHLCLAVFSCSHHR